MFFRRALFFHRTLFFRRAVFNARIGMLACLVFTLVLPSSISVPGLATASAVATTPTEPVTMAATSRHSSAEYVDPGTRTATPSPVLRGFDPPEYDWLAGHRGVDLDIPIGAPIAAAGAGTVHFAGSVAGTPTISIEHDDGIRTTYQPVFARVSAGDQVAIGETIGTLAPPVDGDPGLHWGARVGPKTYINPLDLLGEVIIRLKPWAG